MSYTGECRQQKHTQHAPPTKTEYDYLYGWINKTVTYAKISPKMVNVRDIAVNAEDEEETWPSTFTAKKKKKKK